MPEMIALSSNVQISQNNQMSETMAVSSKIKKKQLKQLDAWNNGSELFNFTFLQISAAHAASSAINWAWLSRRPIHFCETQLYSADPCTDSELVSFDWPLESTGSIIEFVDLFACNRAVILHNQEVAEGVKPPEPRSQSLGTGVVRLYNYLKLIDNVNTNDMSSLV